MKTLKPYLTAFFILVSVISYSQKQGNTWHFGKGAGISFNSGAPLPLVNGQTYSPESTTGIIEGTAVISDSSGALLFYTNGTKVWNRNHQVMPHGDSLFGNFSSTQSSLIIPSPGSNRLFYIFTISDMYYQKMKYGFRYSLVDICLDGGLGDIIEEKKNILLLDTVTEKLTAVRHINGVDYWVIVHKYFSQDFYAFLLTSSGISNVVVSRIGSNHPLPINPYSLDYAIGYLKASPNGNKLCTVSANGHCIAEYFDFDKATGIVSNFVNIQTNSIFNYYGVSFSPDNSKLYIAGNLNDYNIYQYNLNAGGGNADSVKASRTAIAIQGKNYFSLQLSTDGKIYVTRGNPSNSLGVINFPNNSGTACDYRDTAIVFLNGKTASFGLPNFIDSYDYSNASYNCSSVSPPSVLIDSSCDLRSKIKIYPNPVSNNITIEKKATKCKVTMNIYNVLGQLVVKDQLIQNRNTEVFLTHLASGIYYYAFFSDNKKLLSGEILKLN